MAVLRGVGVQPSSQVSSLSPENQATVPKEDFALVVAKSRACPTPTVGAAHARRCMSLLDIKGE